MLVSIMNSVSSFMKIPAMSELHLQAHASYGRLMRNIASVIQVAPHDRPMPGKEACKTYEDMFVSIMSAAPPVSRRTEVRFSARPDVKGHLMAVPPMVKMDMIKTFAQIEAERQWAASRASALMEQRPRRLPSRRFSVPSNARRGGRRGPAPGQIEMVALPTTKDKANMDINGNDTEEEIV